MLAVQLSLFASYAAEAILWVLMILSVFSVGFFIERVIFFSKNFLKSDLKVMEELEKADTVPEITKQLTQFDKGETELILKGLGDKIKTKEDFSDKVKAYLIAHKRGWEKFSTFFATIGSNAPFLGLLGTVLGLMRSFADLSISGSLEPKIVMGGVSDALLTTVLGIVIAIPSIIFHNYCKIKVKKSSGHVESLVSLISSKNIFS